MKKRHGFLFLILITLFIFISCTSDTQKAKELINQDLFKTLKDFDSYQEIESSPLYKFTTYNNPDIDDELKSRLETELLILSMAFNGLKLTGKNADGEAFSNLSAGMLKEIIKEIDSICVKNKTHESYVMFHKFRAKNSFGGYGISNAIYFFDKDLKEVEDRILWNN